MYNISVTNIAVAAAVEKQFSSVFGNVQMIQSEDINRLLIASDREILPAEEMDNHRPDFMKEFRYLSVWFQIK